ncbi:MAG: FtsX-like permease family protein, partial [Candidatus Elarobacter sp.]
VVFHGAPLTGKRYPTLRSKLPFYDRLLSELRAIPGVDAASLASTVPIASTENIGYTFSIVGRPKFPVGHEPGSPFQAISPDFFRSLGLAPVTGRAFTDTDRLGNVPVAIVDQRFAALYFAHESPLGRQIAIDGEQPVKRTIVGVVPTIHTYSIDHADTSMVYEPLAQSLSDDTTDGIIHASVDPALLTNGIVAAFHAAEPALPRPVVETFADSIARRTARARTSATLLAILAAIALLLALAGIYSVVSYNVTQRTHEIGVRMALGARPRDVQRDVLARGLRLTLVGVAIGLVVAGIGARGFTAQLYGIGPYDPVTYLAVTAALLVCSVIALLVPAHRATRVDPMVALRYE